MKKIRKAILFITLLMLFVGIVNASEVSEDITDTDSVSEELVVKYTPTTTKTLDESGDNSVLKEGSEITDWSQLAKAVNDTKDQTGSITLKLGEGTYTNTGTIIFNNSNAVLTIDGNGQTINGNRNQVFHINSNASLVLKNIIIIDGYQPENGGGAIHNEGKLTIINSTLSNNNAKFAGAIYNYGKLTITDSTLSNNTAASDGGAIFDMNELTVINSTLSNNTATFNAGAIASYGKLTITDSTLSNNKAISCGAVSGYKTTITNSILSNNEVTQYAGAVSNTKDMTITNSTLSNNTALYGAAISNAGKLTVTGSTLSNNTAMYGGAIDSRFDELIINDSILINNSAELYGGAIRSREEVTIIHSTLSNNNAKNGGAIFSEGPVKINESVLANNSAGNGGAIFSQGPVKINESVLTNNIAGNGGAIYSDESTTIMYSTLSNNNADYNGGAISNAGELTVTDSTLSNNDARNGGAIYSNGHVFITFNTFTENTAGNGETIDLNGAEDEHFYGNVYESTDIALKTLNLMIDNKRSTFSEDEKVVLNFTIALEHPNYYDRDIIERCGDITIYINGVKNVTTSKKEYALSNLKPGKYEVYITSLNHESHTVNFEVVCVDLSAQTTPTHLIVTAKDDKGKPITYGIIRTNVTSTIYFLDGNGQVFIPLSKIYGSNMIRVSYLDYITGVKSSTDVLYFFYHHPEINVQTWDAEVVQGRSVMLSAVIDYENRVINYGKVYFIIDDKPLLDENGFVIYVPVKDNRADMPYDLPADLSLGDHKITAVFIQYDIEWNSDSKTLRIIENIPEGAGDNGETPSKYGKQETYTENTAQQYAPSHKLIFDNNVIAIGNTMTLGLLNQIFSQLFINGHLLIYIDGVLVFNATVGDDLMTVLFEILKFLGQHEIKVEFTSSDGKTDIYNKTIIIE